MTTTTPPAAASDAVCFCGRRYRSNNAEEVDALRAEVARLTQLVSGGKGALPEGAVAWLDMGEGEASITFSKKHDSNRASKRNAMELFNRVPTGYYPLYLAPQAAPPIAQQGGGEVRNLPTQWRHNAQGCGRSDAQAAGTWRSCARELEAALASKADGGGS